MSASMIHDFESEPPDCIMATASSLSASTPKREELSNPLAL
jgi:hypothetical protein